MHAKNTAKLKTPKFCDTHAPSYKAVIIIIMRLFGVAGTSQFYSVSNKKNGCNHLLAG